MGGGGATGGVQIVHMLDLTSSIHLRGADTHVLEDSRVPTSGVISRVTIIAIGYNLVYCT